MMWLEVLLVVGFGLYLAMFVVGVIVFARKKRSETPPANESPKDYTKAKGWDDWTGWEAWDIRHLICPDCRGRLVEGPRGGECVNLICQDFICGSRFNVGPMTCQRISEPHPLRKG